MSKHLTGRADIYADGVKQAMEDGASLNPGGYTREHERHGDQTYFTKTGAVPMVKGNLLHTADTDLLAIAAMENVTIQFQTDNGPKYLLRGCSTTAPPELDAKSGKAPVEWACDSCVKVI